MSNCQESKRQKKTQNKNNNKKVTSTKKTSTCPTKRLKYDIVDKGVESETESESSSEDEEEVFNVKENTCGKCQKLYKHGELWVQCDKCSIWFRSSCTELQK